ncbi:MAG: 3-oxoacyl-ACP reductase FabG [Burkholderiaceae bacterium]
MNQIDLAGRTAVVTGGGAGIGLAVAQRLAASGARVAIWDLADASAHAAALAQVPQGAHVAMQVNVCDDAAVAQAADRTEKDFGRIDILVCSAGIAGPSATTWEYDTEQWRKVIDINLNGVFYCNRAVLHKMFKNDYGRIVNIASIAGKEGNPNASAYSASKAAVIGLTKSIGKETAKTGIRCNCITPAAVRTAIFDQISQQHIDYMLSKIPMERFGGVDEMAAMVSWMCSEECSFTTGAVFDLSGGRAVY